MAVADGAIGGRTYAPTRPTRGSDVTGDSFLRTYALAGVSLVGPSFSRIFDVKIGPWEKLKHIIEPRVDYTYISDVSDPARIPAFDTIDTTLGQNQVRYAIVNRLLAKTGGVTGSAEEIASLEIAQTYAFSLPQTIFAPAAGAFVQRQSGPSKRSTFPRPGLFSSTGASSTTRWPSGDQRPSRRASTAGPTTPT